MPAPPERPSPAIASRDARDKIHGTRYQAGMLATCLLFGVAMIANTFVSGDGLWFWYASLLRGGHLLYAGMHLPLQPLYVLETAATLALFGNSWLAGRLVGVLHLILYAVGMLLLLRTATLRDRHKAILLGCAFFVSILSIAYRFDDYHVLSESFELYSLVLLLLYHRQPSPRRRLLLAAALGLLSGLSFAARVNDGAALFLGVAIALLCLAPTVSPASRMLALLTTTAAATLTVLAVVHLTGDTLHDYALNSIFRAAASKGGAGNVLAYPLSLPRHAFVWLHSRMYLSCLLLCFITVFLLAPLLRRRTSATWLRAAVGLLLAILPLHFALTHLHATDLILGVSAVAVYALYLFGAYAFARFLYAVVAPQHAARWNRLEILMLIPLGQLASMAMSTGGQHYGIYGPAAVLILLLPIASPIRLRSPALQSVALGMASILIVYTALFRIAQPYAWHSYVARPMFVDRQWYRHPAYGPMIIERDLLAFAQPICNQVGMSTSSQQLLSLPYPFGNYFCNTPPWHNYVQTYYDTSTPQTIDALIAELQTAPPPWILYQQQPLSLAAHERVFNGGRPLPHHRLNDLIEQNLARGLWTTTYTSDYGTNPDWDNHWLLIRTTPTPTHPSIPAIPAR